MPRPSRFVMPLIGLLLIFFLFVIVLFPDAKGSAPRTLILLPVFAIGPVAIAGVLGLMAQLATPGRAFLARVGTVMLVIAFSFLTLMLVVQHVVLMRVQEFRTSVSGAQQGTIDLMLRTVNGVQLGMDFTFDIFVGIGMLLFAWLMYGDPRFGKLVGAVGILAAGYLLFSNIWAFPQTPHEADIFDPAAFALAWWGAVVVKSEIAKRKPPHVGGPADEAA